MRPDAPGPTPDPESPDARAAREAREAREACVATGGIAGAIRCLRAVDPTERARLAALAFLSADARGPLLVAWASRWRVLFRWAPEHLEPVLLAPDPIARERALLLIAALDGPAPR